MTYGRGYVYSLQYHIVWCTKYRKQVLKGGIDRRMKELLTDIASEYNFKIMAMEVMPDHIHLLLDCRPQFYIPDMVKIMKGNTARRLFIEYPDLKKDLWDGHLWKARYVQSMVMQKAHRMGIRIRRVNAWGTSGLAYDGSGRVERKVGGNYSICRFSTGKIYHCDLNASYNIGARYFIGAYIKSLPETARLGMEAKVPSCARSSTCTLSTLISLYAELYPKAEQDSEFRPYGGKEILSA